MTFRFGSDTNTNQGISEKFKSWTGLFMGIAALITALSSYSDAFSVSARKTVALEEKCKASYELTSKEILEMSEEIRDLHRSLSYIYLYEQRYAQERGVRDSIVLSYDRDKEVLFEDYLKTKLGVGRAKKYFETQAEQRRIVLMGLPTFSSDGNEPTDKRPEIRNLPGWNALE